MAAAPTPTCAPGDTSFPKQRTDLDFPLHPTAASLSVFNSARREPRRWAPGVCRLRVRPRPRAGQPEGRQLLRLEEKHPTPGRLS